MVVMVCEEGAGEGVTTVPSLATWKGIIEERLEVIFLWLRRRPHSMNVIFLAFLRVAQNLIGMANLSELVSCNILLFFT